MRLLLIIGLLCIAITGYAQLGVGGVVTIKGRVTDAGTGEPVAMVMIVNTATQEGAHTNDKGEYKISCRPGDQLAANYLGYKTSVISISAGSELIPINITMKRQNYELSEFVFRPKYTPYQADSIERHSTYQRTLARRHEGSVMSPVTFIAERVSKKSKQMFRFQKDFARMENERFIETRYTPALVTQMTYLNGDSLAFFMNAYQMPVDYARSASDLELKMWIRTNYREWKKNGFPMPQLKPDTTTTATIRDTTTSAK